MKTYSNINDFLIDHLFLIDEASGYYFKYYAPNHRHTIPFTALAGHTVESFAALAKKKGWIEDTSISHTPKEDKSSLLTHHASGIDALMKFLDALCKPTYIE